MISGHFWNKLYLFGLWVNDYCLWSQSEHHKFSFLSPTTLTTSCLRDIDKCYYRRICSISKISARESQWEKLLWTWRLCLQQPVRINTMGKWCLWESGLIQSRATRGWFGPEWSFTVTTLNGCQNHCHSIDCVLLEMPKCGKKNHIHTEANFRKSSLECSLGLLCQP